MSIRKLFALTLFAAIAVSSAALGQAAAVVAEAAERPEVPVALVEQQAQLAERQQAPPMRVRRLAAA